MPCNDIGETLDIEFDVTGALVAYALRKGTCGAPVGSPALLLDHVRGMTLEQLVEVDPPLLALDEASASGTVPETTAMLCSKHCRALRSAARATLGQEPAAPGNRFVVGSISAGHEGELRISGVIDVAIEARAVRSCGRCGSCGTKTPPARAR